MRSLYSLAAMTSSHEVLTSSNETARPSVHSGKSSSLGHDFIWHFHPPQLVQKGHIHRNRIFLRKEIHHIFGLPVHQFQYKPVFPLMFFQYRNEILSEIGSNHVRGDLYRKVLDTFFGNIAEEGYLLNLKGIFRFFRFRVFSVHIISSYLVIKSSVSVAIINSSFVGTT